MALAGLLVGPLAACSTSVTPDTTPSSTSSITGETSRPDATADRSADTPKPAGAKVALLLPLSGAGSVQPVALAMRQAAELAVFEQSNAGVQLIIKDDKGTPEGATAAAGEAIREGAEIILGPLLAKSVTAAAQVARASKVPVVAFSSDRQTAGNGVWLVSFLPQQEVHRIIGYAAGQGKKRIAALIPNDAYGRLVEAAFRDAVARSGGQIIAQETFALEGNGLLNGAKALKEKLTDVRSAGGTVDALFLPVSPEQLPQLAGLLPHMQLDGHSTRILGAGGWESADFANLQAFHGAWYAGPEATGWRDFSARFGKSHGLLPPRIAALAHDAIGIASALSALPRGTRFTVETLTRASGFAGVEGQVRLLADGTSERALAILEVARDTAVVVEAPNTADRGARLSGLGGRVN